MGGAMRLRRARPEDAGALASVKRRLPLTAGAGRGGFLLGASREQYEAFIARDWVVVAERAPAAPQSAPEVVGFAVVLSFETLAASDVWRRRQEARLSVPLETFGERPAYFEQLAFLPGPSAKTYATYAAFLGAQQAMTAHDGLLATVVRAPVPNGAALAFLNVMGALEVGEIEEVYPEVGRVRSAIFYLSRGAFLERLARPDFRWFVPRAQTHAARLEEAERASLASGRPG